jgi:hypothetical protein
MESLVLMNGKKFYLTSSQKRLKSLTSMEQIEMK